MNRERTESTIRHFLIGSLAIRNPIATIVVLTLTFLCAQGQTQEKIGLTPEELTCFTAVQGNVAYDRAGNKKWSEENLWKLCQYTTHPNTTIACFQQEMRAHNDSQRSIAVCKNNLVTSLSQTKMPGAARDIDAKNGHVWIIGTTAVGNDYDIRKLAGSSWTRVDGAARRIAVEKSGIPWVINSTGKIYRRVNNVWQLMPGPKTMTPVDIAISNSDEVWITVTNGQVLRWTGSEWTTLIALDAKHVIFTPNPDQFFVVDQDGKRFVRASPTSWLPAKDTTELARKYPEYAIEVSGRKWGIDSSFNIWKLEMVTAVEKRGGRIELEEKIGLKFCSPRVFRSVSEHTWVEFRLPEGTEGQVIEIPGGAYNKYVFPKCNRVWWSDLAFSCGSTGTWEKTRGNWDSDALCTGSPGSSPYVATGNR